MATVSMELASFKESLLSPWAMKLLRPGSKAGGRRTPLLDAMPPAQKNPSEVVGCISYINSYLSEEGLHRRNTLPPVIFDLYSPPPLGEREEEDKETWRWGEEEEDMSHRRGRVIRKKKPPVRLDRQERQERQDQHKISPVLSKQTQAALEDIDSPSATADTLLIELATYPGFNPHSSTPLPHGLSTLEQMKRVTSSQAKLSTKVRIVSLWACKYLLLLQQEWYREAWCKLFYSPCSQAIFLDYFWWFFLHKYQTNQHSIQDLLFTRISNNYVKMLCDPIDIRTKDTFFKMYPDVIAQCVYTTLLHAYPNSWNNFDEDFKSELCQYISLWQVGTKPMPNSWRRWELYRLEPSNLPKLEDKGELGKSSTKGFNFDVLLEEAKEKADKEAKLEAYFEKRLSLFEVKRRLSNKKHSIHILGEHSRKASPSLSTNEKRVGIALEQLSKFDNKAVSMAQRTPYSTSQLCNRLSPPPPSGSSDLQESLSGPPDSRESLPSLGEGPLTVKPRASQTCKQRTSSQQFQKTKLRQSVIKVTDPEGQDNIIESRSESSQSSSKGNRGMRTHRDSIAMRGRKQHRLSTSSQKQQHANPSKKQPPGRVTSAQSKQKTASPKQDRTKTLAPTTCTRSSQQSKAAPNPAMRAISAPAFSSSSGSRPSGVSFDATPIPGTKSKALANGDKKSGEEYFTYKKMALSLKEKAEKRESATLKGPAFDHVVFNVYGHSPLVKHYMDKKNLTHINEKEVVVGRTEIGEEPPQDAVCYRDVLTESKTNGDINREQFLKHYRFQRHAMITADRKRVAANQEHEQNVKMVLGNKKEVQHLSNELALHALQSKLEYNKQAVSNVITTSLKRASMSASANTP